MFLGTESWIIFGYFLDFVHVFGASIFASIFGRIFDQKKCSKWFLKIDDRWSRFFDLFRIPTFGRILDDFGLTLGSLWRPFAPLGAPFGALVAPVGVPWGAFAPQWVPFGLILVALWLQLGSFGPFLVAFWPLWFHFGSFWFAFRFFFVVLDLFLVRTLSSLGPRAELLPQANEIDAWTHQDALIHPF